MAQGDMVKTADLWTESDREMMQRALAEAEAAGQRGEVPVGAVLVDVQGRVLAEEGNRTIELSDPAGHAEMLVLRAAAQSLGNYRLLETTLYVTLEPCPMCAAALVHARVGRLVFGPTDPKGGGVISRYEIGTDGKLNHTLVVDQGLLAEEGAALLTGFFRKRRDRGK